MYELFDDRFSPRAERSATEASAEPTYTREADTVRLERIAVEHLHTGVGHDLHQLRLFARLVIVIAEHRDDGNLHRCREVAREHLRFFGESVVGEIAGE